MVGKGELAPSGLRGSRLGLLPGLIFRRSWRIGSKVLGLPLGVQKLQSFQLRGVSPTRSLTP